MTGAEHVDPETLNAFLDGELADDQQELMQEHLKSCHDCTLRAVSASQLKAATRRAGNRFVASPEALSRLTKQLRPGGQSTKAVARMPVAGWLALAAALVMAITFAGWSQYHTRNSLAAELLDQHLAVLSGGAVPEVVSSDRHTVKPWFQGRIPFSFDVPDGGALPPGTVLQGADLTYLEGQPAALLLFTIRKHQVTVFVTQRGSGPAGIELPKGRAGFSIRYAEVRGLRLIAVSDVNAGDLEALVALVVRAQAPG